MDIGEQVKQLLSLIEAEKLQPEPDKKQMRKWLSKIRSLRWSDDYWNTYKLLKEKGYAVKPPEEPR